MRMRFLVSISSGLLLSTVAFAQSDEEKAKAFFKNNLQEKAEAYISGRIEQSLSERFKNLEIDITDLDDDDTRFTVFSVQPLYDNREAGRVTFFQGSLIVMDDADTLNLGLGQRWILRDGTLIAGVNLFYDNEWDAGHERVSIGGELLSSVGDLRINHYKALSDTELANGANETALDGMDMELAVPLPYLPHTRIHAKSFKWEDAEGANDIEGDSISLRATLPRGFELEAGSTSYENAAAEDADFVSLSFNLARFRNQHHASQPQLISDQAFALTNITERRFEKVRRKNQIVKQVRKAGIVVVKGAAQ